MHSIVDSSVCILKWYYAFWIMCLSSYLGASLAEHCQLSEAMPIFVEQ